MKKYFKIISLVICTILIVGCNKDKDVLEQLTNKIESAEGYHILGNLELYNDEDKYTYDVEISYQKENNFKVSLKNTVNNHEQVILRNKEGVYILTPSLNKSFKFESQWPYNSSQIYLLQTILKDIQNDDEKTLETIEDYHIFTTKVDYSNNQNLTKQKIIIDKEYNIKEVQILNDNDEIQMKMEFTSIDLNTTYNEDYFVITNNDNVSKETSNTLDSIIYPMYLPINTTLTSQEKIKLDNGERIILTFGGESSFVLIQETVTPNEEVITVSSFGEPQIVTGTIGSLEQSSITWVSNNVEFYIASETLDQEQLLKIANSVNTITVGK